jgi:hypothetical protein
MRASLSRKEGDKSVRKKKEAMIKQIYFYTQNKMFFLNYKPLLLLRKEIFSKENVKTTSNSVYLLL